MFFLFFIIKESFSQDPQFSQFYAAPLYLCPSFAGTSPQKTRVALSYRNQWPEIPRAYTSYSFSFDHYISNIKSGIGFLFLRDQAGPGRLATTNIGGIYSFDINLNDDIHVRPGAHFLYTYRSINFSELIFYDQVKYNLPSSAFVYPDIQKRGDVDFSLSTLAYREKQWLGVTIDHLLKPNQSFFGDEAINPMKYSVFGGTRVLVKQRLLVKQQEDVSFAFLYKQQALYKQFDVGAYYFKTPMVFGIWYRGIPFFKGKEKDNVNTRFNGSDAAVFLVGYRLEGISLGYSYDITISKLRNKTGGAHEVTLVWNFKLQKWQKKPSSLPCPHF